VTRIYTRWWLLVQFLADAVQIVAFGVSQSAGLRAGGHANRETRSFKRDCGRILRSTQYRELGRRLRRQWGAA
jgi:hypothetical protein